MSEYNNKKGASISTLSWSQHETPFTIHNFSKNEDYLKHVGVDPIPL